MRSDEEMLICGVDCILPRSKRQLSDVGANVIRGSPTKSVAFEIERGRLSFAGSELVGVVDTA